MSDDLVERLNARANGMGSFGSVEREAATELTRLRERNAELEKELDLANRQIAATGRAWSADRTRLEATVREMMGVLEDVDQCFEAAYVEGLSERLSERDCELGSLEDLVKRRLLPARDYILAALAASESVVGKSEGEGNGRV